MAKCQLVIIAQVEINLSEKAGSVQLIDYILTECTWIIAVLIDEYVAQIIQFAFSRCTIRIQGNVVWIRGFILTNLGIYKEENLVLDNWSAE